MGKKESERKGSTASTVETEPKLSVHEVYEKARALEK
jgi:hypothetical protein